MDMLHQVRQDLAVANRAVRDGLNLDIVGDRGSGRTTLLRRLSRSLTTSSWTVRTVHGFASFKNTPLAALALAGCMAPREARPVGTAAAIAATVEELAGQLAGDSSAIIVDDWDDLDETSWGVINAVHQLHGTPVITARLHSARGRQTPAGLSASSLSGAHELRLRPLHFDDLGRVLQEHLDAPMSEETLSRIYAKTGGNLGLARTLVDAAVHDELLHLVEGRWQGAPDMWTDTLGAVVRTMLEPLDVEQRDLLEVLSVAGTLDLEMLRRLTTDSILEQLEEDGFLEMYPSAERMLVTVSPPLLVEYFRHDSPVARRNRLSTSITEKLGSGTETLSLSASVWHGESRDAQLVRLVHEQLRSDHLLAQHNWATTPSLATATPLVHRALLSGRPIAELDGAISAASGLSGTEEEVMQWTLTRADVALYQHQEPLTALEILDEAGKQMPRLAQVMLARAAEITMTHLRDRPPIELPEEPSSNAAAATREALIRARGNVALAEGRVGDSQALFRQLDLKCTTTADLSALIFSHFADYLMGDPVGTIASAQTHLERATDQLDLTAIRGFGALTSTLLLLEGRQREAGAVMEQVFMLGAPIGTPPFSHLSLIITASVLAARRGDTRLAAQRLAEAEDLKVPNSPLPGGSRTWAETQSLASSGHIVDAADHAVRGGDEDWAVGSRIAAVYAYLGALEIDPTPNRVAALTERIASIDSPLVAELLAYATARAHANGPELLTLGRQFTASGRYSHALSALELAASAFRESGESTLMNAADAERKQLLARLPEGQYDQRRGSFATVELTKREAQIARLASSGLSNQQIAVDLVLSVRTVESHLHRVMRKLGVERRTELAEHL